MGNKEIMMLIKIMTIIAVVCCGLSLIAPWAGFASGFAAGALYLWGADLLFQWSFFYYDFFTSGAWQSILIGVGMIVLFVVTLITFIKSLTSIKKIDTKGPNILKMPGILTMFCFIFFIVMTSIAGSGLQLFIAYGWGFYLILISSIMFLVGWGIPKLMGTTLTGTAGQPMPQQMYYQQTQPQPTQPTQATPQPPAPVPAVPVQQPPTPHGSFCASCGRGIPAGGVVCPYCGTKVGAEKKTQAPKKESKPKQDLPTFCPQCGKKATGGAKFCLDCGAKLS